MDVQDVSKHYHRHTALSGVSLAIQRGRVFGLLGPNGAGKTTLIRIINYITRPDSGLVLMNGHPLTERDVERIGYLPEERGLYRKMEVGEQAIYLARLKGLGKAEARRRLIEWFERLEIMPWWGKKVEELSKGMQQKVQFVTTVLHEPELLIFDEPFSGFDPVNAEVLKREMLQLKERGATIIFSTHNMQSVEELCDDIALIHQSKLVLQGSVEAVRHEHGTGGYRLAFRGLVPREAFAALPLLSYSTEGGQTVVKVQGTEGMSLKGLISGLPDGLPLVSAEAEVASMHEIFLKSVGTGTSLSQS